MIGELEDAALRVQHRGNHADSAEDRLFPEARDQDVDMPHAIEKRDDHRVRPHGWGEIAKGGVERECLHRQDHGVERPGRFARDEKPRGEGQIAVGTENREAAAFEVRGARRPHEERHVPPGLSQASAEIAAGRAGADNEQSHTHASSQQLSREETLLIGPNEGRDGSRPSNPAPSGPASSRAPAALDYVVFLIVAPRRLWPTQRRSGRPSELASCRVGPGRIPCPERML
jgi:hypothetical protein